MYGCRAFAVAGPMTFNALPEELRDPTVNATTFRRLLKTHFFSSYLHVKRIRGKDVMCYINTRYLLTAKNPKCNGIGFNLFLKVCREGA